MTAAKRSTVSGWWSGIGAGRGGSVCAALSTAVDSTTASDRVSFLAFLAL